MIFREAVIDDIQQMHIVRLSVTENELSTPGLVTPEHYRDHLLNRGKGWLCEVDAQVTGFGIVDLAGHNVWALFVSPSYEGLGIGRHLHDEMLNWYFRQTRAPLWLTTATNTRAQRFYCKSGWREAGVLANGEIRLEMGYEIWNDQRRILIGEIEQPNDQSTEANSPLNE